MKPATLIACLCLAAPATLAQHGGDTQGSSTQRAVELVNDMCPIGKEPIMPSAGTVEYKGKTIGICCPGCGKQFLAWNEARKDEFVTLAVAGREPGMERAANRKPTDAAAEHDGAPAWTDPYPLDTCPISGEKLGSMGDPIVKTYGGREVRFCCPPCIATFEADLDASWKKIDDVIVKDQLRYYPLDTCVVSGEKLGADAVDHVHNNRLVRLADADALAEFKADPETHIATLDKAAADAQRKDYPLKTCVVAGSALGSMGEPTEMVVAGRLTRFCCASCQPKVNADPATYIAEIDKAWQAEGRFMPEERGARSR